MSLVVTDLSPNHECSHCTVPVSTPFLDVARTREIQEAKPPHRCLQPPLQASQLLEGIHNVPVASQPCALGDKTLIAINSGLKMS